MNKRSRVYMISQPTIPKHGRFRDFSPLSEFGDIVVVIGDGDAATFRCKETWEKIANKLRDFDPLNDYIVWTGGDTLSACMFGHALAQFGHFYFRWLRFDRGYKPDGSRDNLNGKYVPVECNLV